MEHSCHISKQGCHSREHVNFRALKATRKENNTCNTSAIRLQPLPKMSTEQKTNKHTRILGPDS